MTVLKTTVTTCKALFLKQKVMHAARGPSICFKVTGPAAKYQPCLVQEIHPPLAACSLTVTRTSECSVSYQSAGICSFFRRVHPAGL